MEGVVTEEDIRTKVVAGWLAGHGLSASELTFEYTFSVKIGRSVVTVGSKTQETQGRTVNPRSDVLVKRNGQNLLIVEVKAPGQSVESARDQGISYARLLDQIAPFVVVTDGESSRIYDSISKNEISGELVPTDHPHAVSGFRISVDDLALRYEAIELFISLSPENLLAFCRQQVTSRMQRLRGDCIDSGKKYISSLYVERKKASEKLRQLSSQEGTRVVVVTGRPQIGKTNFLCNFVQEEIAQGRPCLFFPSISMTSSLLTELADDFGWSGFSVQDTAYQITRTLSRVLAKCGTQLTIVMDGWNEAEIQEAIAIDKEVERISNHTTNILTVVSFTNTSARRLLQNRGNPSFIAEAAGIRHKHLGLIETNSSEVFDNNRDWSVIYLEHYNSDELVIAYQTYAAAFDVSFECQPTSDPFLLSIAMRHYQGKSLPVELDEQALLDHWLKSRIARANIPSIDVQSALTELGTLMLQLGAPVELTEVKRRWGIPLPSSVPSEYFDCALLARYPATHGDLIDFYYSRDRDFVISIWAAKWHERIDELLRSTTIFKEIEKAGQASVDAALWFFSQRSILEQLVDNGTLPEFECTEINCIFLRGFANSLSRFRYSLIIDDFFGFGTDHWSQKMLELVVHGEDDGLRSEALKSAIQLSNNIDPDSLLEAYLNDENGLDRAIRSILELDFEAQNQVIEGGLAVEFLVRLDYDSRVADEDETFVSDGVRHVMNSSTSRTEHLLAAQAYASMRPRSFLQMLKGIPGREQQRDYLVAVQNAVNAVLDNFYGYEMCPSYMSFLEGSPDLTEEEYQEIYDLLSCLDIAIWNEAPVKRLRKLMEQLEVMLPDEAKGIDANLPRECHGQTHFEFWNEQ